MNIFLWSTCLRLTQPAFRNVFKRPREETTEAKPPVVERQTVLPTEKPLPPEKDTSLPKIRHLEVPAVFTEHNVKTKSLPELLKEYKRYWKVRAELVPNLIIEASYPFHRRLVVSLSTFNHLPISKRNTTKY